MAARVYITGAAGSGTTSLGQALAVRLGVPLIDTDAHYWAETDPPFTAKRPVTERLARMAAAQCGRVGWVLAGSCDGWGDCAIAGADLIVFLTAPTPIRLARLRRREAARWGARIAPGGDMAHSHVQFLKWAAGYDEPYFSGRSLARHRAFLAGRPEPVLELLTTAALDDLLAQVLARLLLPNT